MNEINLLINLLSDKHFLAELKAYRLGYQRLKIRLRNNLLIAKLKQLATMIRQLESEFPHQLFRTYAEKITNNNVAQKKNAIKTIVKMIGFLDKIIDKTIHVYCYTQPHFKVGHLSHHLIFIRTAISRLRICFKALLVYASDLYMEISGDHNEIRQILIKHSCKPRVEHQTNSDTTQPHQDNEIIGQLVDRATMKLLPPS